MFALFFAHYKRFTQQSPNSFVKFESFNCKRAAPETKTPASMDPDETELVRTSFAKVAPIKAATAAIFYDRLFQVAPELRGTFPTDVTQQGAKLMAAIGFVVAGLDRLESIIPQVHELGCRHVDYAVRDAHYDIVGDTLIWTLEKVLGAAFTPETRKAWIEAYGMVAEAMIAAPKMRAA